MKAAITQFLTAAQRGIGPVHPLPNRTGKRLTYIGTVTLSRCDGVTVLVDLHITTQLNVIGRWFPQLLISWSDADLLVTLNCVSDDDDCTPNQVALKFLRDYVKNNWWELVNEPGFHFDK